MTNSLLSEYLNKLGRDWDSIDGLKNHSILFVIIFFLFLGFKPAWSTYLLIALLLCLLAYYSVWKIRRSIKFILFKKVNIIFALHNVSESEEIEKYLKNFESNFRQQLNSYQLSNIKVNFLASDRKINSTEEAEKLVRNGYAGHTLIVWGDLTEHEHDIKCKNTNFTYEFSFQKYFPKTEILEIKKWFNQNTQIALNSLNWNLNLKNRQQLETYGDNIKDVSVYILGRTLLTVGEIKKGIEVLQKLLSSLNSLTFYDKIRRGNTIGVLKELLSIIFGRLADRDFWKRDFNGMKENLNVSLKYNKENYYSNLQMAYYQEMVLENETESKKYLELAERYHKRGQNGYMLSKAYFHFKSDKLKEGLEIYGMLKRSFLDVNEAQLVDNLRDIFEKRKQPQFLFVEGLIKVHWFKTSDGKKVLRKFLKLTKNEKTKYKVLIEETQALLAR